MVLRRVGIFGLAQIVAIAAGLLLQMIVARALSMGDYGRFVVVHSMTLLLLTFLMSAVPNALRRLVSVNRGNLAAAWRSVWRVQLPIAGLISALFACLAPLLAAAMHDSLLTPVLLIAAADTAVKAGVLEPCWHLLNGLGRHVLQAWLMMLHSVMRAVCVICVFQASTGLLEGVAGLLLSTIVSTVVAVPIIHVAAMGIADRPDRELGGELLRWVKVAPGADVLNYLVVAANLWVLKAVTADPSSVGSYAACYMLTQAVLPFSLVLSRGSFASFAQAVSARQMHEASRLLSQVVRIAAVAIGCGFAVAWLHGEAILGLVYGDGFMVAGRLLGVLGLGMSALAVLWFLCEMLAAAGKLKVRLTLMMAVSAASAAITVFLVRVWGSSGAASALLITGMLGTLAAAVPLSHLVGLFVPWRTMCRAAIAAVGVIVMDRLSHTAFQGLGVVSGVAVISLVYFGLLVVLCEWDLNEWRSAGTAFRSLSKQRDRHHTGGSQSRFWIGTHGILRPPADPLPRGESHD